MKTILRENTWLRGIPGFHMDCGWGNGYVIIPVHHCLHGVDYDNIPVSVHGGLTFGREIIEKDLEEGEYQIPDLTLDDVGAWMVGFDTAHSGDSLSRWPKKAVEAETNDLRDQLMDITEFKLPQPDDDLTLD